VDSTRRAEEVKGAGEQVGGWAGEQWDAHQADLHLAQPGAVCYFSGASNH